MGLSSRPLKFNERGDYHVMGYLRLIDAIGCEIGDASARVSSEALKEEGARQSNYSSVGKATQGRLLGPEGEEAVSQLRGMTAVNLVRASLGMIKAAAPWQGTGENDSEESKPRMGNWHTYLEIRLKGVGGAMKRL